MYQRIEHLIEKKLPLFETEKAEVVLLMDRVEEAKRLAKMVSLLLLLSFIDHNLVSDASLFVGLTGNK